MPPGDASSMSRERLALGVAGAWLVLMALYILFVGSLSLNEAMAGATSALLASLWWARVGRIGGKHFDGWFTALRPLGGALLALPAATMKVGAQLVGIVLRGVPQGDVAYRSGADSAWARSDEPAERAYGLIATSLSPDSYILRDDEGDGGVLDHALTRPGPQP